MGLFKFRKILHENCFQKALSSSHFDPTTMKTLHELTYDDDDPLQTQFNSLKMEWDSIKQSFSRSDRRRSSIDAGNHLLFQLCDCSPKEIMSLLQNENSPNSGHRDRADSDNGRLMGRRLFEEPEEGSDDYGEFHGGGSDRDEKSQVSTEYSHMGSENYDENYIEIQGFQSSFTDSVPSEDVEERDVMLVEVNGGGGGGFVGRRWVFLVIMLFALAMAVFKCSGEDEQFLVPT